MNLGLKDFFIGVVHLFVIFIPGGLVLLTIGYVDYDAGRIRGVAEALAIGDTGVTLLFVALSYIVGHLVSLVASKIEDKAKWVSRYELSEQGIEGLRPVALGICEARLGPDVVRPKTLRRWCAVLVKHDSKELRTEIDAKDADRRFFRSLPLVLTGPLIIALYEAHNINAPVYVGSVSGMLILALIMLSLYRYRDQDAKFTRLVFESLIALDSDNGGSKSGRPTITHAGGVVVRKIDDKFEYLLVQALRKKPDGTREATGEWVLPKGHIEPSEVASSAAKREVGEETGYEAEPDRLLGLRSFEKGAEHVCVAYYLMSLTKKKRDEKKRTPKFYPDEKAGKLLTFESDKSILETACRELKKKENKNKKEGMMARLRGLAAPLRRFVARSRSVSHEKNAKRREDSRTVGRKARG